jgi:hypothetical protein
LNRRGTSPGLLLAHNIDALVAVLALPVFLIAGWPVSGWFWAVALWAANRFLQVWTERRAAKMTALRGVGVMGASMLLRPWIGMLLLFLIVRDNREEAISSLLLLLLLVTVDIATRIFTHRNVSQQVGGTI